MALVRLVNLIGGLKSLHMPGDNIAAVNRKDLAVSVGEHFFAGESD